MLRVLAARRRQGFRTVAFPDRADVALPDRFRGRPEVDPKKCRHGCRDCAEACPTDAIRILDGRVEIDLGRCLFCDDCRQACPAGAIACGRDYRLAARTRADLVLDETGLRLACALEEKTRRLLGRSLKLRVVSAGGCNACEADTNVLTTIGWDLSRFGIQYVAAPRHADGLLITGPVTTNMRLALRKTYDAVPSPKIVIAVGACAISGGPYGRHPEQAGGADAEVPVDLYIPGCPPHPLTILDGMLRLLGRIESGH